MSFREFAEKSWPVPEEFWSRRYNSIAHGVGMGNEWPLIPFRADSLGDGDDDQIFEENMVLAIETCIGREDDIECVKLEDMIIVRAGKCQLLSTRLPQVSASFCELVHRTLNTYEAARTTPRRHRRHTGCCSFDVLGTPD